MCKSTVLGTIKSTYDTNKISCDNVYFCNSIVNIMLSFFADCKLDDEMDQPKRKYVCRECDEFSTDEKARLDGHYLGAHRIF